MCQILEKLDQVKGVKIGIFAFNCRTKAPNVTQLKTLCQCLWKVTELGRKCTVVLSSSSFPLCCSEARPDRKVNSLEKQALL